MAGLGPGHLAQRHLQSEVPSEHVGARAEEGHLDYPTGAGLPLLEDGGQYAGEGGEAGDVVTDAAPGVEGAAVTVGHLHGQARPGPEGADVVGGAVPLLTPEAVAADAAVDEARMTFHRGMGPEVQIVQGVGSQIADEDVGRGQQVLQVLAIRRVAEVEDQAALAPVVEGEGGVRQIAGDPDGAEDVAHGIAGTGLDLDHLGTPVGQEGGGGRRRHPHPQLDHPEVGQRGEAVGRRVGHAGASERPRVARSRRRSLTTLPVALTGSSVTSSTTRGTL